MEIKNRNEIGANSGLVDNVKNARNPYKDQQIAKANSQVANPGQDTVTLSSQSKTLLQASKILDQDAVARREKVDAIKARVNAGTYSVDSEKIASSMISYFNEDAKAGNA